jgi:hypothetical protein
MNRARVVLLVGVLGAVALRWPAVAGGLQDDDYIQAAMLDGDFWIERGPLDLFWFSGGNAHEHRALVEHGYNPWWTHPQHRVAMRGVRAPVHQRQLRLEWPTYPLARQFQLVLIGMHLLEDGPEAMIERGHHPRLEAGRGNGPAIDLALERLPADFREVIVLREMEGLSYREIAAVVGVPIGTVMSRLARARERLQTLLKLELKQIR